MQALPLLLHTPCTCCYMQSDKVTETKELLDWIENRAWAGAKTPRRSSDARFDSRAYTACAQKAKALRQRALKFASSARTVQTSGPPKGTNATVTMERVAKAADAAKFAMDLSNFLAYNITIDMMRNEKDAVERLVKLPSTRAKLCAQVRRMNGLSKKARALPVHWRKLAVSACMPGRL